MFSDKKLNFGLGDLINKVEVLNKVKSYTLNQLALLSVELWMKYTA